MNFEDLQKTWQAQPAGAMVTIGRDSLLRLVRRNQRQFRAMIFWRDVREVGVSAILAVFFGWKGWNQRDWTSGLLALICFGVGAYMLADRWWQRRHRPLTNEPLKDCLEASLHEVNHQIWLLKNVLWWYLLPLDAGVVIVAMSPTLRAHLSLSALVWAAVFVAGFTALISWGVYWLNQLAVRKNLEPRRQELEALLASLD